VSRAADTLNVALVTVCPATTTEIAPVDAPIGTGTTIFVSFQLVGIAGVPLKLTVLVPWAAPKFAPVIVTIAPTTPEVGEIELIDGGARTVKFTPVLAKPLTVTTTLPVVAPVGTDTTICPSLQLAGVADVPLKLTVLVPWVVPKLVPVIVTAVPTGPALGEIVLTDGGARTVKLTPLPAAPFAVTTTFPVVAPLGTGITICVSLQLVGAATKPLNATVLAFRAAPNPVPVIETDVPIAPALGVMPDISGTEELETEANVVGEVWLLYSVLIQSAEGQLFVRTRTSSILPTQP
jgi:hypothetical protein